MSFNSKGSTGGNRSHLIFKKLADSLTFVVGGVVKGYDQDENEVAHGVAAQPILGVLNDISDSNGNPIVDSTITAGTAKSSKLSSIATGTSDTYYGYIEASRFVKFSALISGTLGTTNQSDFAGARIDVDSSNTTYTQLLETTATRTIGTPANFYSHGIDPGGASQALASANLLVSMAMSELEGTKE